MNRCASFALVSRISFLPPVTMPTVRRSNTPLSLSASRHMRMRRLLIILLPLALLMSGTARSQSTVSLFTNVVPVTTIDNNNPNCTLGVKFFSSKAGTISAIRFYRAAASPKGYVVSLYSTKGKTKLGQATIANESSALPGWQTVYFAAPISIAANTTYIAAYYAPSGQYSDTQGGLTNAVTNAPLTAPAGSTSGGNGVWANGNHFPNQPWVDPNFFVDVVFTPAGGSPYLSIVVTPANPTIPSAAALGSVVAKLTATWSDGSPFTGTLSLGSPNSSDGGVYAIDSSHNLIINPSGPGVGSAAGSVQNVTIAATAVRTHT